MVFWSKPENLLNCDIRYNVLYDTELDIFEKQTVSQGILIRRNEFCFHVTFNIQPQIGDGVGFFSDSYLQRW